MTDKSRWQEEFDALPEWAQNLVRAASHIAAYGGTTDQSMLCGFASETRDKYAVFQMAVQRDTYGQWSDGFAELLNLADALTAPWPPPPAPIREKRAFNVVESLCADPEDCAFDQPCCFGNRVESHAVYCHNEAWPNSPRKCRRNREDYRHEDCPGFVANPDFNEAVE